MRKEVILAVVIGLTLGLVITYGVYTANQATRSANNQPAANPTPNQTTPTPAQDNLLVITSPPDGTIFNTPTATITGQLQPDTHLIILSESEDLVVPTTGGQFQQTVKLTPGANLIQLLAVSGDKRQQLTLNLLFSTTKYE